MLILCVPREYIENEWNSMKSSKGILPANDADE